MRSQVILGFIGILAMTSYVGYATDPGQLQDFCVGINGPKDGVFVNGFFCKNPMDVTPNDFFFRGLHIPGSTNNKFGSNVTRITAMNFPGLNTLGISLARVDIAPFGINTPHSHPRATEVLTVLEGTLYVGFVASNPQTGPNRFFFKILSKGDVFIFPQGLTHFELNVERFPAVALSAFSSHNPGVVTVADAMFGANPPILVDALSKSFLLDKRVIFYLQSQFRVHNGE